MQDDAGRGTAFQSNNDADKHILKHFKQVRVLGYDRKMNIIISNTRHLGVAEIEEFLKAPKPISFSAIRKKETYKWIETTLVCLKYKTLKRQDKIRVLSRNIFG